MALQLFSHHRQWRCNYLPTIGNGAAFIFPSLEKALQLFSIIGNGAAINTKLIRYQTGKNINM
jgi:hypothetical protein